MDDFEGGRLAVEYLAKKGHVHIAGIFKSDDRQGLERYAGFNEGLHQAGLPINDRWGALVYHRGPRSVRVF